MASYSLSWLFSSDVKDFGIGLLITFELSTEREDEGFKAVCSNFTIFRASLGYRLIFSPDEAYFTGDGIIGAC